MEGSSIIMAMLALLLGYGLGSIPFGVIITRLAGAGDVRDIGSGNIGATNVLRTGRKGLAVATLLLDMAKGAAAVCLARMIAPDFAVMGGVGAFFGHLFSVWIGFKGGKGVATMMGICLALAWPLGIIFALVWGGALAVTRISSVGGMSAAIITPLAAAAMGQMGTGLLLLGLGLIVLLKHRDNIERLIEGTEPRVGQKKP
jgi:glycerol-3-phosphate acyltransferase PlsY